MIKTISAVIDTSSFRDDHTRKSVEKRMHDALPTGSTFVDLDWYPIEALDGSGDIRWVGSLVYDDGVIND